MNAQGTLLLYAVFGVVVGATHVLRGRRLSAAVMLLTFVGAALFWPVFLPFLLRGAPRAHHAIGPHVGTRFDTRIQNGERRLEAALGSLGGVAEHLLAPQRARLHALGDGLRSMAARTDEMAALLDTPEFERQRAETALVELGDDDNVARASLEARLRNIDRLERMHRATRDELERALLRVEEIGSQMVLLKFVDDPDREALRLLDELALTVEGATEGLTA